MSATNDEADRQDRNIATNGAISPQLHPARNEIRQPESGSLATAEREGQAL
jgi:hypothetical protein